MTVPTAAGEVPASFEAPPPSATESPTTTAAPEGDRLAFTAEFTNSDGWEYRVDLDVPAPVVSARKDVSSSPPGEAQLDVIVESPLSGDLTVSATQNAGRPDGPPGALIISYVWTELSAPIIKDNPSTRCTSNNYRNPGPSEWEESLVCSLHADDVVLPLPPNDEALVDEIVAAVEGEKPIILIETSFPGECGVAVAIMPDGSTLDVSRDDNSENLCAMTVEVSNP